MTDREKLEAELKAACDAGNAANIAQGEAYAAWDAAFDALAAYDDAHKGEMR